MPMGKQSLEEVSRKLHSAALHLMRYVRTQDTAMGIGPAQASALHWNDSNLVITRRILEERSNPAAIRR